MHVSLCVDVSICARISICVCMYVCVCGLMGVNRSSLLNSHRLVIGAIWALGEIKVLGIYWGKKENKNSLSVSFPLRAPVCLSGQDTNRPCAAGLLAAVTFGCPWPCPMLACCWSLLLSPSALRLGCIFFRYWHFSIQTLFCERTVCRERSILSTKGATSLIASWVLYCTKSLNF